MTKAATTDRPEPAAPNGAAEPAPDPRAEAGPATHPAGHADARPEAGAEPAGHETEAAEPADSERSINILIVDDEPRNLLVLETVLDDPQYRLIRATSAEEALLAMLEEDFALLILDINMPGTNGFELAKLIKQRRKTAQVPIIFLTAFYNNDEHQLEGYGTGAVDFLHKPVNAAILRSKVAVFAELHRKQQALEASNAALRTEVASRRAVQARLRDVNATLERQVQDRTAHVHMLMNEVNHRSKNIFSLIMAITKQTASHHPEDFVPTLFERIQALARNHDLLVNSQRGSVELSELIRAQLSHFQDALDARIRLDGRPLFVTAAAGQSIGMAIHELATNAVKYGALSSAGGRIEVRWDAEDADNRKTFRMSWTEQDGPPVVAPERKGFGTRVVKQMLEIGLEGRVELSYEASGVRWRLACDAGRVLDLPPAEPAAAAAPAPSPSPPPARDAAPVA